MSADEYTPSTATVRAAYMAVSAGPNDGFPSDEFDRWLAQYEAKIRADQIKKDAAIARSNHSPNGYGPPGALNSGSRSQWYSRGRDQAAADIAAQSLLPREVTDGGAWEFYCRYSGRITAEPCEASGCPGHHVRRTKAGPWHPVPDTNEGETDGTE